MHALVVGAEDALVAVADLEARQAGGLERPRSLFAHLYFGLQHAQIRVGRFHGRLVRLEGGHFR